MDQLTATLKVTCTSKDLSHELVAKGILTSLPSPGLNGIIIVSYTQGTHKCLIAGLQYILQHMRCVMNVGSESA